MEIGDFFYTFIFKIKTPNLNLQKKSLTEVLDVVLLNAVFEEFRYAVVGSNYKNERRTKTILENL